MVRVPSDDSRKVLLRIQKCRRPTSDLPWSSEGTCAVVGCRSIALNPKFHFVSKGAKCEKAAS